MEKEEGEEERAWVFHCCVSYLDGSDVYLWSLLDVF
jgi:hypothetical protein